MAEFTVQFKRFDGRNNVWVPCSRIYTAPTAKAALKELETQFANDVVPVRMTRISRTVMLGELETRVVPRYVH